MFASRGKEEVTGGLGTEEDSLSSICMSRVDKENGRVSCAVAGRGGVVSVGATFVEHWPADCGSLSVSKTEQVFAIHGFDTAGVCIGETAGGVGSGG